MDPESADDHNQRGLILAKRKKWRAAEAALTRALRLNPEHAKAWANLTEPHRTALKEMIIKIAEDEVST